MDVLCRHIEALRDATGSYDHIAIGSDLDGFVKPTLPGVQTVRDLGALRDQLTSRYPSDAASILETNALRVLFRMLPSRPSAAVAVS